MSQSFTTRCYPVAYVVRVSEREWAITPLSTHVADLVAYARPITLSETITAISKIDVSLIMTCFAREWIHGENVTENMLTNMAILVRKPGDSPAGPANIRKKGW